MLTHRTDMEFLDYANLSTSVFKNTNVNQIPEPSSYFEYYFPQFATSLVIIRSNNYQTP